jgi:AbiV family abortive infection protein
MSFGETKVVLEACLANAQELLKAARVAEAAQSFAVAHHLAALSLEEIGKSVLVLVAINSTPDEKTIQFRDRVA